QLLKIILSDGHISRYSLFGLRKNCPCVSCRGGHSRMGQFERSFFFAEPTQHYEIIDIRQVGHHAVKIEWNDGHNTGMYQWETLRDLCHCKGSYPEQESSLRVATPYTGLGERDPV